MTAGQQVVWRIHKKLPGRWRNSVENKNRCGNFLVGYDTFFSFFVLDEILIVQSALFLVGFDVSVHLVRLPNLKK